MINGINDRELALNILLDIENGEHSDIAVRETLSKHQFLPKQERAFITRLVEGTLEYQLQLDYIIDFYSNISVDKMKLPIRVILRSAVYQIFYMDSVPDSAAVNEAVRLAQKKGFFNLKSFVNGVLRSIVREKDKVTWPLREMDRGLWGRKDGDHARRISGRKTCNGTLPYLSLGSGAGQKKPGGSGSPRGAGTVSALCTSHQRL